MPVDILRDHLVRARASGGVFARSVATPPWGIVLPGFIQLSLHTVVSGGAWVWVDDPSTAVALAPGDLALVTGGRDHHLAHGPDPGVCVSHEQFWAREPDHGSAAVFLCGAYRLAGDVGQGLLHALPPLLVLHPADDDPLHDVVALLARELSATAPGQQTVLDRLLDVLLVLAMRAAYEDGAATPRWYHAASDPRLSKALHAIHARPEEPWTVPRLAGLCSMSRPAFARNFERALGQTPMQYLTDWRLTLARDRLRTGDMTLERIARSTGYGSPNAFAAAFKRHVGQPPGQWRLQELATVGAKPADGF